MISGYSFCRMKKKLLGNRLFRSIERLLNYRLFVQMGTLKLLMNLLLKLIKFHLLMFSLWLFRYSGLLQGFLVFGSIDFLFIIFVIRTIIIILRKMCLKAIFLYIYIMFIYFFSKEPNLKNKLLWFKIR